MATRVDKSIRLGIIARDKVSGLEGTLSSRLEYLTGCVQWGVTTKVAKDSTDINTIYIDQDRLEYVSIGLAKDFAPVTDGGPSISSKSMRMG